MMNPRAYSLSSTVSQPPQRKPRVGSSNAAERVGTRPAGTNTSSKRNPRNGPPTMTSISPAAPSKPVVIPTRTKPDRRQSKSHVRDAKSAQDHGIPHDARALSPSAAAFFAIASRGESERRTGTGPLPKNRANEVENGPDEALNDNTSRTSSSASSPCSWRLLLSAPEEIEDEDSSTESGTPSHWPLASFRSLSSESMPSLETDCESAYASSSPSTPGFPTRGSASREMRSKSISSSVTEACHSDHPLLLVEQHSEHEDVSALSTEGFETDEKQFRRSSRLSLKSNLTASLRRLKSAARNMTTLGAPATSQDDVQTQAAVSATSQFADERRPLPWAEPPDPALRRYLNPITVSPAELYSHRGPEERRRGPRSCTASIQLQTYQPGARKSENATAPPVFVVASSPQHKGSPAGDDSLTTASTPQRHREPRENSDFLRVIVLEMNMRKVGKLSDVAPGRARLWLPARRSPASAASGEGDGEDPAGGEIPRRWTSLSP
ncbi:MAG: hypothetical protein L6R36_000244 [Xanthoria steineri]|nr:MAG: hypothetical protein L6R36_000244 [Xanthoria steineri]